MTKSSSKIFQVLLPGLLLAATGVGAGDLITASLAGINGGLILLWAPLIGALLKWSLTEGLARYQLATGETLLEGWFSQLGSWIRWLFIIYLLIWTFMVGGALVNACGIAANVFFSFHSDTVISKAIWGTLHSLLGAFIVYKGGFRYFGKIMTICVCVMFPTVILSTVLLNPDWNQVLSGMTFFQMPKEHLGWTIGLVGGVGGTVTVLSYGYWIREAGRKGKAGLKLSQIDLGAAYFFTALFSVAMVIIGSQLSLSDVSKATLPQALVEQMYVALGPVGQFVFLIGFWAVVFSSLLGVWQGVPYLFADFYYLWKKTEPETKLNHTKPYYSYLIFIAVISLFSFWIKFESIQLMYAVMGAFFMPLLALTLLILNNRKKIIPDDYRNGWIFNLLLLSTLVFFIYAGFLKISKVLN